MSLGVTMLGLGCPSGQTGPTKIGQQPTWRTNTADADSATHVGRAPGQTSGERTRAQTLAPMVFAPTGAAVTSYNDPPRTPAPSDPLADAVVAAINDFYARSGGVAPTADGRLYRAADELAEVIPEDTPIAYPLIEFALQRHGI
ncbi:MAG: hypothetical protein AAGC55_15090, partial [Myxococcota bacterium]